MYNQYWAWAGPGGPVNWLGGPGRAGKQNSLGRAGLSKYWATLGRAGPWKMARFRGLIRTIFVHTWDRLNGQARHFSLQSLNRLYKKNEVYNKMQREKLYNLHKTAYFNCVVLVSEKKQNWVRLPRKNHFFIRRELPFYLISSIK